MKAFKILISFLLWVLIACGVATFYFWNWLNTSQNIHSEQQVYLVEKGSNIYREAEKLHELGVLRWPKVWVYFARYQKMDNIKAGEYRLQDSETPVSLLNTLIEGKTIQYSVTLVEGQSFKEFLSILHSDDRLEKTLAENSKASEPAELYLEGFLGKKIDVQHFEGWFFPDTYQFSRGDTDYSILQRAYNKMRLVLDEEWETRSKNLPYKTPYEALIMASIIEKETGVPHEREDISGVFVRRLNKGMKLQTDPTIIYGMGDAYKGNITRRNLREATPYNTYVIKGLPPTPIAMPGREAIHAALHPKKGESLFFVAKGDGTHQFSATLNDHNNAVNKYQKVRVKNYRSSPVKKSKLPTKETVKDSQEVSEK